MNFNGNQGYGYNYSYNPQFNMNFFSEEAMREKRSLFRDCTKLGVLLIIYNILNLIFAYGFYYVTYYVLSKKFTLSYVTVVTYLLENHESLVRSTVYQMGANIAITVASLALILIIGKGIMKISFHGFIRPTKQGAKTAVVWAPACFVINMIFSLAVAYFTSFMNAQGVTVPTSDFSISSPSAASILMQLAYVVILAPIIEEFIYRGIILGVLTKYGNTAAILLSAAAFALMHGNIPQAASAFGTGIVYAIIAVNCGSVFPTIIIHMTNNLIANFMDVSDVLNLAFGDLIFSIVEIAVAILGFFVIFTHIKFLKVRESGKLLDKRTVNKTVFTNPAVLIYLAFMVYEIIKKFFYVN